VIERVLCEHAKAFANPVVRRVTDLSGVVMEYGNEPDEAAQLPEHIQGYPATLTQPQPLRGQVCPPTNKTLACRRSLTT
jgi:hypothetical protein